MKLSPSAFQLYAITEPSAKLTENVRAAIDGGITMLQIREKNCTTQRLIQLAYPLVNICRNAGIPCIINDNVEAARVLGADGVHVGQRDMKLKKAREILGDSAVIGTSAHSERRRFVPKQRVRITSAAVRYSKRQPNPMQRP